MTTASTSNASKKRPKPVHFYILLDRSGSMDSMRSDVVGGFNAFLSEQQAQPGRAKVTLVQFDSQNPQEILLDAVSLANVSPLPEAAFQPRGGTPLLDATSELITRVLGRQAARRALGKREEEIVFITITDGEENSSRVATLEHVNALINSGKEHGWSFVFLGAGLDAYADAQRLGYDVESVQAWKHSGKSARTMMGSVSRAASQLRHDVASNAVFDKAAYFRGIKEAEAEEESGE
jgi:uncharacterized protein YegL